MTEWSHGYPPVPDFPYCFSWRLGFWVLQNRLSRFCYGFCIRLAPGCKSKASCIGKPKSPSPPGAWHAPYPMPPGFRSRGAGGGSPRRNKVIISPFPAGEGGRGDRGQKGKLKAGAAGDRAGKPPLGTIAARSIRQPKKPAPAGFLRRRFSPCRPGSAPGMQGAEPLA